ncbi:hypothetical protein WJ96_04895 [Burkholderia ubonensis]|uniref:Uncharacterized protein n=1 Tax=Burkholderia ubonensis TaxID=101571 RepID=A0AAW3MXH5_9BURK|nr:hypothetical protein [Burkholderia ubonensis]KVP97911.1 hypothetical protein WJ96_04895 [Burkholderia ubonensis]KVZ92608.1 hypothetical protein WL25_16550 [Burkholderia ubonensis]
MTVVTNASKPLVCAQQYGPHALLLLVCAAVGAAAQYYQPDLGLLDGLGLPKWAECVAGISFIVLFCSSLAQGTSQPVIMAGMALLWQPLSAGIRRLLPADEALQIAYAHVQDFLLVYMALFTALVPLTLALALLSIPKDR